MNIKDFFKIGGADFTGGGANLTDPDDDPHAGHGVGGPGLIPK